MVEKDGKQYLTVREFSKLAGISKQAVYSQVSTRLEPFTIQLDGQKMIEKMALDTFYSSQLEQPKSQVSSQVSSQVNIKKTDKIDGSKELDQQGQGDVSRELLELLKEEIKKKDQQIEKLQESLDKAYMQISEMAQKAQYITAADKTEKIIMLPKQQKEDTVIESTAADLKVNNDEMKDNGQPQKSFWKRLFKK